MRACWVWILAAATALAGCRNRPPRPDAPRPRIVSFSPALTSIVFEMGLGDHVVGVTKYCELPAGQKRRVAGDRQNVNLERIVWFEPDVVLIQQDPRDFARVRLVDPDIRLEHFTIEELKGIGAAMERIGRIAGNGRLGEDRKRQFEDKLAGVRKRVANLPRPRVLFLTGIKPPSVPGRESFLHEMIVLAGGEDVTADYPRWTRINIERMIKTKPDVIVCHQYQADAARARQAREYLAGFADMPAARSDRIFVVTDRRWTIPSAFLAELVGQLAEMIHPELKAEGGGD